MRRGTPADVIRRCVDDDPRWSLLIPFDGQVAPAHRTTLSLSVVHASPPRSPPPPKTAASKRFAPPSLFFWISVKKKD